MKLEKWALIAEIVSGAAIVATLVILISEVRSNTEAIQAQTTSNFVTVEREQNARLVENVGGLAEVMLKVRAGEELNRVEEYQYRSFLRDQLNIWEWYFFEVEEGRLLPELLDPERWAEIWSESPGMTDVFESVQVHSNPSWIAYMEQNVIALVPPQ